MVLLNYTVFQSVSVSCLRNHHGLSHHNPEREVSSLSASPSDPSTVAPIEHTNRKSHTSDSVVPATSNNRRPFTTQLSHLYAPIFRIQCRNKLSSLLTQHFLNDLNCNDQSADVELDEGDTEYLSDSCDESTDSVDRHIGQYRRDIAFLERLAAFFTAEGKGRLCLACYCATTAYMDSGEPEEWEIRRIRDLELVVRCPTHVPDTFANLCRHSVEARLNKDLTQPQVLDMESYIDFSSYATDPEQEISAIEQISCSTSHEWDICVSGDNPGAASAVE